MNCLQVEEYFSAHFEDALDYQTLQLFENHITECPTCQREYARFRESVKGLQELPQIEPSPYFMPTLQQRISQAQRDTLSFWERLHRTFNMPRWALSGIMVLILVTAIGTFLYHDDLFNRENQPFATPRPEISSESPSVRQFLPRGLDGFDFSSPSAQPMQQNYTLKHVSYTTVSTGGGL